ncbi:MAG: TIGR00366 family protein [Bacteroidia bacterium]
MKRRSFIEAIPGPFLLAILLSITTMLLAFILMRPENSGSGTYLADILGFWYTGFWSLLSFTMQMMLILVLGHVLALTPAASAIIDFFLKQCKSQGALVFFIMLLTLFIALFNWGMGLIFGAVMARKAGEYAARNDIAVNYPLLGAAGYSGLMVWHGGLSGSAPLKVAEPGHFLESQAGVIPVSETLFSDMNLAISAALILLLPLFMWLISKRVKVRVPEELKILRPKKAEMQKPTRSWLMNGFGLLILISAVVAAARSEGGLMNILTLNYVNFLLFGLGMLLMPAMRSYLRAVDEAILGAAGILIQFPLYAGIMGIMADSGLLREFTGFFISISNSTTLPLFTFISAGLVNLFVPSGGGQWALQGPIIIEAAKTLGVPLQKAVMALAYGDQITNMLQPFWALPLLGVTGLKAQQLLPYTALLLLAGSVIFVTGLLLW